MSGNYNLARKITNMVRYPLPKSSGLLRVQESLWFIKEHHLVFRKKKA